MPENKILNDSTLPDPPESATVWRYMDFTQLMSILENRSLYFSRVEQFRDPFEGTLPEKDIRLRKRLKPGFLPEPSVTYAVELMEKLEERLPELIYLNCWHMNEYESAAMWDLYSKSSESIAIKSTTDRLYNAFGKYKYEVFLSPVEYVEKEGQAVGTSSLHKFLWKRKSFEHENELRAVLLAPELIERLDEDATFTEQVNTLLEMNNPKENLKGGRYVDVDVNKLIENVYIHPDSPGWFVDLVKSVFNSYGLLANRVKKSSLYEGPLR